MPKRMFEGENADRNLVYKCEGCRRYHEKYENALDCEHGHVKMLVYEQQYAEPEAAYPHEVHVMFADGNLIKYRV